MSEETAAENWRSQLQAWAIPEEIMAKAEEEPWTFPLDLFRAQPQVGSSPARERAAEALPAGGSVLDVGAGGGAASLALAPPAAEIWAVDQDQRMLDMLRETAQERDVPVHLTQGSWPQAAGSVGEVDVVVCHHVLYNVPEPIPFVRALTAKARRRVVLELTERHPLYQLNPLFLHFHGLERPSGPTAEDALAVIAEAGVANAKIEHYQLPPRLGSGHRELHLAFTRRRLCLPKGAQPELDRLMPEQQEALPREVVAIWWDSGGASA